MSLNRQILGFEKIFVWHSVLCRGDEEQPNVLLLGGEVTARELVHVDVRVGDHEGRQLAQNYPGLEKKVQFFRLHQFLLLGLAFVVVFVCIF